MSEKSQIILKLWEKWYPSLIALFATVCFYIFDTEDIKKVLFTKEIMNTCITISGILFGFLLTILALLLQSESKAIELIKKYNRFGELIHYNRIAVYSSALSLILSFVLLIIIGLSITKSHWIIALDILKVIWLYFTLATMTKTYRYIDIFYTLIK